MDYYKLLGGLKKDCSQEDIENAYKQLAPKFILRKGGLQLLSNAYESAMLPFPSLRDLTSEPFKTIPASNNSKKK